MSVYASVEEFESVYALIKEFKNAYKLILIDVNDAL